MSDFIPKIDLDDEYAVLAILYTLQHKDQYETPEEFWDLYRGAYNKMRLHDKLKDQI